MKFGLLNPRAATVAAVFLAVTLGAAASLTGCVDYDEIGENRVEGGRGYPCLFPEDCAVPLGCFAIEGEANNVCSGPQAEGAGCFTSEDCQYKRNDLGLPLTCIESQCLYVTDQAVPSTQQ